MKALNCLAKCRCLHRLQSIADAERRNVKAAVMFTAIALMLAGCGASDVPPAAKSPVDQQQAAKSEPAHEGGGLKLSEEEATRAGIKVESMAPRSLTDIITVTATIHPNQDRIARVAPRVEGRIVRVLVKLGDAVRAGQALAVLDSIALGEAQSALLQAQSTLLVAQSDYQRAETLSADEIIPRREYLRAKAELDKTSAELRAAQDKVRLLGGSPKAGGAGSSFQLISPLAGTVIQKSAVVGELGTPSGALFTVADLSTVWIEANVAEDNLSKVRPGADATVTVAAYPGERFSGRVIYVASILDKESRTVPARIEVANKDARLKLDMFASATIETGGAKRDALMVPDEAILLMQGQPTIFVAEHGSYEARPIEPGERVSGHTVVKSGVAAGDEVVTSGAYALKARLLKSQISDEH